MSPPDSAAATAAPLAPAAAAPAAAGRKPAYRRILLKLSGEALMGDDSYGIERATIDRIVAEQKATVNGFTLYIVGEGIEKKKDDFAAEVAAMSGAAA